MIQQLQNSSFASKIFEWLLLFILGLGLAYFLDRYFRFRPKILVFIDWDSKSSEDRSAGKLKRSGDQFRDEFLLIFRRNLRLKNNSKYEALDLEFIWPSSKPLYQITFKPHTHLLGFNTLEMQFLVSNSVKRELVLNSFDEKMLLPPELQWAQFAISYKNEKGKTLYTRFTFKNGGSSINTFHWFKPKLQSSPNIREV